MTLENCPYRRLAEDHRELVCGMNYEVIAGLLEAVGVSGVSARLDPASGRCCVTLVSSEVPTELAAGSADAIG